VDALPLVGIDTSLVLLGDKDLFFLVSRQPVVVRFLGLIRVSQGHVHLCIFLLVFKMLDAFNTLDVLEALRLGQVDQLVLFQARGVTLLVRIRWRLLFRVKVRLWFRWHGVVRCASSSIKHWV